MDKKNKSEPKLEEANFEVSSLSEVKDENGNGIFHMRTKTKVIAAISVIILAVTILLIYLTVEKYFVAEMWQVVIWGLCGVLALYSIFARSVLTMLLNIVLFAGVSFIPTWQAGYETVQPAVKKISTFIEERNSEPAAVEEKNSEPAPVEEKVSEPAPVEEKIAEPATVEERNSEPAAIEEKNSDSETDEEKISFPQPPTI